MRALLIGAGAVGQIYGWHLARGGAAVSFYVKPKYASECRAGLRLYPLNGRKREPVRFDTFEVLSDIAAVREGEWDSVWLCISSTALRGDWLAPMLDAIGDATLVTLQPGLEERAYLAERYPVDRTVYGVIAFVSYQAPLETERGGPRDDPGVAFWHPPLQKSPFSGVKDRVAPIVRTLQAGRCPARVHADASRWAAGPTAIMMPHLAALEREGWTFDALGRGDALSEAAVASRQALSVVGHHYQTRPSFARFFVRAWVLRTFLWLARRRTPFDLETYLRYHFTKVADQTRYLMGTYIEAGRDAGLPVDALEALSSTTWPPPATEKSGGNEAGAAPPAP